MRDCRRSARRHLSALPQLIREGNRAGPRNRVPHRHRLQGEHSGLLGARRRYHGERAAAGPRRLVADPFRSRHRARGERSAMSQPSTAMKAPVESAPRAADAVKPRILIVDDEPSMREMLRIVLRRDGYDVLIAENGKQAIALLQRERVDLLLSDIRMPDVTGVDVLRVAKEANRDIVAFMMTAFASTETAVEAMRLGAVDYLTKPFSMDELRLKIGRHLESHRLKQENVLLKRALNTRYEFSNIIGRSDSMLAVFKMIETIAKTS